MIIGWIRVFWGVWPPHGGLRGGAARVARGQFRVLHGAAQGGPRVTGVPSAGSSFSVAPPGGGGAGHTLLGEWCVWGGLVGGQRQRRGVSCFVAASKLSSRIAAPEKANIPFFFVVYRAKLGDMVFPQVSMSSIGGGLGDELTG